jgi:phosphohistidine swiveling domain-containing protein
MKEILNSNDSLEEFKANCGGKALNLAKLVKNKINVPKFICLSQVVFEKYIHEENLIQVLLKDLSDKEKAAVIEKAFTDKPISEKLMNLIVDALKSNGLLGLNLAVRSSGLDEDSSDHSFAGLFSSYLFQRDITDINLSIRKCWSSSYSERALSYRRQNSLNLLNIKMGVVIQEMVNSEIAGVIFSRNPVDPLDRDQIIVESVYGQGEGLVSGVLDADNYMINRNEFSIKKNIAEKEFYYARLTTGPGIEKLKLDEAQMKSSSLSDLQIVELAKIAMNLEKIHDTAMDIEWAISEKQIYVLQMRPITNLPNKYFYDKKSNGSGATLWDNSNIVESFNGVTTPLTFSVSKKAYSVVYKQTCRVVGVPESIIQKYNYEFDNMLGFIRGRVYYNLINWYKLLFLFPGASSNKGFMETMMGVKEDLHAEHQKLFDFVDSIPKYSTFKKIQVVASVGWKFLRIDKIVHNFLYNFNLIYTRFNKINFKNLSLKELIDHYEEWNQKVTYQWKPPIINDFLVMLFFGVLKKLTEKWLNEKEHEGLQNDLLCGQGDLESTMPTKTLMIIANTIDCMTEYDKEFFLSDNPKNIWKRLVNGEFRQIKDMFDDYLNRYGFRCNDEQKLEENDLNDDPSFSIGAVQSYIRMKSYSIEAMALREKEIKESAERKVKASISGIKQKVYFWVLKHARNAVKNRENMRFARTKSFGINRKLFRAVGFHLQQLDIISEERDVFYLTIDELVDFVSGTPITVNFKPIIAARKSEYDNFRLTLDPPDRFITYGACGSSFKFPQVLSSGDLLKAQERVSDDPNILIGISCCPGVITGKVRVAHKIEETENLNGEILVTYRTDPGWVPLYPSCSGLIIERGSLLSHSAVVARELGLPTIVGVSGGLMKKLKTGDTVELNATKGEIRIIRD